MPEKQTASYLSQRFREVGIRPDTRHGQNFLVDLNLLELLARTAQVGARDVVLEVGTGTGSLTGLVAPHAAAVVTVEIDSALHQLAQESLVQYDNICLLHLDALKNKNRLAVQGIFSLSISNGIHEGHNQDEDSKVNLERWNNSILYLNLLFLFHPMGGNIILH